MSNYRKIQDSDVKGLTDVTDPRNLINNAKIYVDALSINKTLKQAIIDGDLSGGGGGTSGALTVPEALEQKLEVEHYQIRSEELDNSVGNSFEAPTTVYNINGVLMDSLASGGTSATLIYAPLFLSPSDPNTSSVTGWTAQDAGTNLVGGVSPFKVGGGSLSFDKNNSGTNAGIRFDRGVQDFNVNGFSDLWFWINLPSVTDLVSVEIRALVDTSNYQTYTLTTTWNGGSLATGWNLMYLDLTTAGVATGTGWNSTTALRYFDVRINTGSASTTYSGILVNGIFFAIVKPARFVQPGTRLSIYSLHLRDTITIAASNTRVDGAGVALSESPLSGPYLGGLSFSTAGIIFRNTLLLGGGQAIMHGTPDQNGNATQNAAALTQEVRLSRILRTAVSGKKLHSFVCINTQQVYAALTVGVSTIVVDDPTNQSADLVSGDTVFVFATTYDASGDVDYDLRGSMVLSANSTASGGQTTLHGTPPVGTVAGDIVVKDLANTKVSMVGATADESFSAATPLVVAQDAVILVDTGISPPNFQNLLGSYNLGFPRPQKNVQGTLPDLSLFGSLTTNSPFKNGQFASTGWSSSNYYEIPGTITGPLEVPVIVSVSFWYFASATGTGAPILGYFSGGAAGWYPAVNGSNQVILTQNTSVFLTGSAIGLGWHHIALNLLTPGTTQIYVDGVLVASGTGFSPAGGTGTNFRIGSPVAPIVAQDRVAQLALWNGTTLTGSQVGQLYNSGLARILGFGPMIKYRYLDSPVSGQKMSLEAGLKRTDVLLSPFLTKAGIYVEP